MQSAILETGAIYVSGVAHEGWDLKEEERAARPPGHRPDRSHAETKRRWRSRLRPGRLQRLGLRRPELVGRRVGIRRVCRLACTRTGSRTVRTPGCSSLVRRVCRSRPSTPDGGGWCAHHASTVRMTISSRRMCLMVRSGCSMSITRSSANRARAHGGAAVRHRSGFGTRSSSTAAFRCETTSRASRRHGGVFDAALERPLAWLERTKSELLIYAHGGLNSESASITRIRAIAPYAIEAGIYPLFVTWRSGPLETVSDLVEEALASVGFGVAVRGRGVSRSDHGRDRSPAGDGVRDPGPRYGDYELNVGEREEHDDRRGAAHNRVAAGFEKAASQTGDPSLRPLPRPRQSTAPC